MLCFLAFLSLYQWCPGSGVVLDCKIPELCLLRYLQKLFTSKPVLDTNASISCMFESNELARMVTDIISDSITCCNVYNSGRTDGQTGRIL